MTALKDIPQELKKIRQWNFSKELSNLKKPFYTKYEPDGGFTYEHILEVLENSEGKLSVGFYTTLEDPYVIGDIDHLKDPQNPFPELPPKFAMFLKKNPTYIELSPSGEGLRFFYKLEYIKDKKPLAKAALYSNELKGEDRKNIQANVAGAWMRLTGNRVDYSERGIATIPLSKLTKVFSVEHSTLKSKGGGKVIPFKKPTNIPAFSSIQVALSRIPLDQNPRIKRAYEKTFKQKYSHHDFWLKLLMALHDYSKYANDPVRCLTLAIEWSSTDPTSYEGEEEVQKRWISFDNDAPSNVTFKSLLSVYYYNKIVWKYPARQTKEEKDRNQPPRPAINQHDNFLTIIDFYNIKIHSSELEEHVYYLTGDKDIMQKYFKTRGVKIYFGKYYGPFAEDDLKIVFNMFLQVNDFTGISHRQTLEHVRNTIHYTSYEINLFKKYIDTPFDELPDEFRDNPHSYDTSTVDELYSCLTIKTLLPDHHPQYQNELALYRRYYRCWLMGLLRGQYYKGRFRLNNCILILSGREHKRKSSHFSFMLPEFFEHLVTQTTQGFTGETAMRELTVLTSQFLIVSWDDNITKYLTAKNEDNFKKITNNSGQAFRDKYKTTTSQKKPFAIYGGTTNKFEFPMGDDGTRRLFIIPTVSVDTDKMLDLCWHPILNELKDEMEEGIKTKGLLPWDLSDDERQLQDSLHRKMKSGNNIDLILEEVYAVKAPFKLTSEGHIPNAGSFQHDPSGTFKTMSEVIMDLQARNIPMFDIKRPALKNALHRLCGNYTKTHFKSKAINKPVCKITKGLAEDRSGRKKWVMPPLYDELNYLDEEEGDETDFT